MRLGIIGTSIWQQNMPLLERLSIDTESKTVALHELKEALGVEELIHLSTCNRVEMLYVVRDHIPRGRILHRLIDHFFKGDCDVSFFPNDFYHYQGKEAVSHLFRTVASLESLVLGETQITGQFKDAFNDANECGLVGSVLDRLGKQALAVAKRVKRETSVGEGSVSMASLASDVLVDGLKDSERPIVALIGAGAMTKKSACHLRKAMSVDLVFVNRTVAKAEALTETFVNREGSSTRAMSLEDFRNDPGRINAIISATSANDPVFDAEFLNKLTAENKTITCIDLALPRDFSTDFDIHPGVTLIDIAELKSRGNDNLRQKFVAASKANDIVREEVANYHSNRVETSLKPIVQESYQASVQMARQSLDKLFADSITTLTQEQQDAVHRLVTKLIGHASFQSVKTLSEHIVDARGEISLERLESLNKEAV